MTFHTPKSFKFATIGRLVQVDTQGNTIVSKWVSEMPTNQVSFNIGVFEEVAIRDPRIPPVTVQINSEAHRLINQYIPSSRSAPQDVSADIVNSLSFFTKVFGPPLFHSYYATEIPYFHGQAFPGLIHLSWYTFLGMSTTGEDESFRAHEMAHQWWGIGVEPASDRDAWLSEGFAEFAGMWYMQIILNDNDKYFKMLRDSRDEIRRQRGKSMPLGLGYRAMESWKGAYSLTTYQKGAWVLHMLRNLMIDSRTMSEARFQAMMRDFYETYRGKRASTADFQRVVERHVGQPMDWFFDEWVNGTDVPSYRFAWKTAQDSAGFPTQIRVRQSDVPPSFGMYVPMLIKFDQGESLVRVLVRGPTTETTLRLPARPKSIELNPLESVLADVKTEGWD
jgi:aminopeptidase N